MTPDFFIRISSLSGNFEVIEVVALAYDASDGYGDQSRAVGVLRAVPEPASGTIVLAALGAAWAARRRA